MLLSTKLSSSLGRLLSVAVAATATAYTSTNKTAVRCEAPACKEFSDLKEITNRPSQPITVPHFSRNFVADAVEKVLPSVVRVEVHAGANQRGSGSGFAVDASQILPHLQPGKVLVITNAHCVLTPEEFGMRQTLHEHKTVHLETNDPTSPNHHMKLQGRIIAFDAVQDVALIEPFQEYQNQVAVCRLMLQPNKNVRVGEFVVAVGAPLRLENTVTVGIVSNNNRRMNNRKYYQTDAASHVGNSGGPLVNVDGEVIGINVSKFAEGITYVIPIDDACRKLREAFLAEKAGNPEESRLRPPFFFKEAMERVEQATVITAGAGTMISSGQNEEEEKKDGDENDEDREEED